MARPQGYSLFGYGKMVQCDVRMAAYTEALKTVITPGCIVIDIGAGFGIFSIIALQLGAGEVIAIEPDPSSFLIEDVARANGVAGRVTIFRGLSTEFQPERRADVIVSDLRNVTPLLEYHIPSIVDARERLLKPGGRLLPKKDTLKVALVHAREAYNDIIGSWSRDDLTVNLAPVYERLANSCRKVRVENSDLLSEPVELATLDYRTIRETRLAKTVELEATAAAEIHGLAVWFDAEILDGIGFSNAPGEPEAIYGQWFMPFMRPLRAERGDRIFAEIAANLIAGDYIWSWNVRHERQGLPLTPERTRQSTFYSQLLAPEAMQTRADSFVPSGNTWHAVDAFGLELIDGKRSIAEIAQSLQDRFNDHFLNSRAALEHAAKLCNRY